MVITIRIDHRQKRLGEEKKDLWLEDLCKSLNEFLGGAWQTSGGGGGHEESEQIANDSKSVREEQELAVR